MALQPKPTRTEFTSIVDNRPIHERSLRASQITATLKSTPNLDDEVRLPLLDELANIHDVLGNVDEALRIRQEDELPVYERLGDVRSVAVTKGQIADIFQARGDLDEALRIRQEDSLPVYERLGDVRSVAVTKGKIADIFQARGDLDEALRIYREVVFPIILKLRNPLEISWVESRISNIQNAMKK